MVAAGVQGRGLADEIWIGVGEGGEQGLQAGGLVVGIGWDFLG